MASPSEMGGLYPPLAQRHSESAAKLVEGTDAGVSRWEEWAKLVQVSPFLLCLLRNPSPLDKLTSYLGEIWPGGGADKRGGKFHLITTYGKVQKRQWERYISKVMIYFAPFDIFRSYSCIPFPSDVWIISHHKNQYFPWKVWWRHFYHTVISRSPSRCLCCKPSHHSSRSTSSCTSTEITFHYSYFGQTFRSIFFTPSLGDRYLWTVVILWVVDENSARGLHVPSLEVAHHPEPVVEEALVVEVEVVHQGLPIVASLVGVGGVTLTISPHIGKPKSSLTVENFTKHVRYLAWHCCYWWAMGKHHWRKRTRPKKIVWFSTIDRKDWSCS